MTPLSIIPIWARLLFVAVMIGSVWALGDLHGHTAQGDKDAAEKLKVVQAYDARIGAAQAAKDAADAKTRATEVAAASRMGQLSTTYQKEIANETAAHARAVADLRSGATRLRVSVAPTTNACSGSGLPQATAAATGSDVSATAVLAPDIAARLAARDAAYQTVAAELKRCQQVVEEDRRTINGVSLPAK